MRVAGVDLSTRQIDVCLVSLDGGPPVWRQYPLSSSDSVVDRLRSIPDRVPGRTHSLWDDVAAVGVERPAGRHGVPQLSMVFGAVVPRLPVVTIRAWLPAEWRRRVGLPGNAAKQDVAAWAAAAAREEHGAVPDNQDACDAYAIAHATRLWLMRP